MEKRFTHDCKKCQFLGIYKKYDLYFCKFEFTVIARYSNNGSDYLSGMAFARSDGTEPLYEARKRAIEKGYIITHTLCGDAETRRVSLNGEMLRPGPSQKVRNHSPEGFNWGYGGSGPAQLALAIMLRLTGKPDGYQDLKFKVIAGLPQGKDFDIEFEL